MSKDVLFSGHILDFLDLANFLDSPPRLLWSSRQGAKVLAPRMASASGAVAFVGRRDVVVSGVSIHLMDAGGVTEDLNRGLTTAVGAELIGNHDVVLVGCNEVPDKRASAFSLGQDPH